MGQYYVIVNLDKKEFISPHPFGDGSKLLEFGCSSDGIMTALAVLTACGNGEGMGDLCRTVYESDKQTKFDPEPWEMIHAEWAGPYNHRHERTEDDEMIMCRTIVPTFAGSWHGDRIVTAGDAMDDRQYLTDEEYLEGLADDFCDRLGAERRRRRENGMSDVGLEAADYLATDPHVDYNLQDHAFEHFADISEGVSNGLNAYDVGRANDMSFHDILRGLFTRRVEDAYQPRPAPKPGGKHKWETGWMTAEFIDSFLRRWSMVADFRRAKQWLQRQHMEPWQRDFVKAYRANNGQVCFYEERAHVLLREHGINWYGTSVSMIPSRPMLPCRELLDAAIRVQEAGKNDAMPTPKFLQDMIDTRDDIHGTNGKAAKMDATMQLVAKAAGLPVERQRVIEVDKPHDESEKQHAV